MTRSKRMQPVVRVAEMREQAAAKELGNAQRYLQEQEDRLSELQGYQAEYARNFHTLGSKGISAARFQELQRFMASLNQAIEQQQQAVQNAVRACAQKKQLWQQAHGKSKSLDKVVEHYCEQEQYEQGQREQKAADEMAQHGLRARLGNDDE
jgi:flagellar export protein FliJ